MLGHIDRVVLNEKKLLIQGWAIDQAGIPDGFILTCGGRDLGFIKINPQPSPDIEEAYPLFDKSPCCRFSFDYDFMENLSPSASIVSLKPVFQNGNSPGILFAPIEGRAFPGLNDEIQQSVGGGNSFEISMEFLNHFVGIAQLQPTHSVLDVGCGFGRMALGLTQFLNPSTRYEGFDVSKKLIEWARENITSRYPNFNFQWLDVHNGLYNPNGKMKDQDVKFSYGNDSFHFVVLTSVFTQMLPQGVQNYLNEIYRILKPGGRVFVSLFLINHESQLLMDQGKSRQKLPYFRDDHSIADERNPDTNVGYNEKVFSEWCKASGFNIVETIYGDWSGRQGLSYQDFILLQKL